MVARAACRTWVRLAPEPGLQWQKFGQHNRRTALESHPIRSSGSTAARGRSEGHAHGRTTEIQAMDNVPSSLATVSVCCQRSTQSSQPQSTGTHRSNSWFCDRIDNDNRA